MERGREREEEEGGRGREREARREERDVEIGGSRKELRKIERGRRGCEGERKQGDTKREDHSIFLTDTRQHKHTAPDSSYPS